MVTMDQAREMLRTDPARAGHEIEAATSARIKEPGGHAEWGAVCEEARLWPLAIREYQLALKEDAGNRVAVLRCAEIYQEQGYPGKAVALLERFLGQDPADPDAVDLILGVYARDGLFEKTGQVLDRAATAGLSRERLDAMARKHGVRAVRKDEEPNEQVLPSQPAEADVLRFLYLFSGREDTYARQWWDAKKQGGYTPVREPLTPQVARNHLLGNITVGVYPIRLDGTVMFFAVDLDISKSTLERSRGDLNKVRALREIIRREAARILEALKSLGLDPLFESSGYKGRHYWVFFERPASAEIVHHLGGLLLHILHPLPSELHLEFFPRQPRVRGGLGNLIKLPLGIHRRTGRRSEILLDSGEPDPAPFERLCRISRLSGEGLERVVRDLRAAAPAGPFPEEAPDSEPPPEAHPAAGPPPPERPPAWTAADFEHDRQVGHLLTHCAVLGELKRIALNHRQLSSDEQVVLVHTLGHLAAGVLAVNYLFGLCLNIAPASILQSKHSGHPISCPRIRKRIPKVTARTACHCDFTDYGDHYPTPLLHLRSLPSEPALTPPAREERKTPEEIARVYGVLLRKLAEVETELRQVSKALMSEMERAPERAVALPGGRFVLRQDEGALPAIVWMADAGAPGAPPGPTATESTDPPAASVAAAGPPACAGPFPSAAATGSRPVGEDT